MMVGYRGETYVIADSNAALLHKLESGREISGTELEKAGQGG